MSKQQSHNSKTIAKRSYYNAYIQNLDPEPTLSERLNFQNSTKVGEDKSIQKSKASRKIPVRIQLEDIVAKYWWQVIISIAAIVCIFLVYEAKSTIDVFDVQISDQQKQMESLSSSINLRIDDQQQKILSLEDFTQRIYETENNQNLLLNELKLKFDFVSQLLKQK